MTDRGYLLDTGPLVSFLQKSDQDFDRAQKLFSAAIPPLKTCEAVISEACFLMRKISPQGPADVLELGVRGIYEIGLSLSGNLSELKIILEKYKDRPISLADACLIRMAEIHEQPHILTFDSDFEIYRWNKTRKFEILS